MLKREALLTLALQTNCSLEATSAPTLHRENDGRSVKFFRVGALLAPGFLEKSVVWHLSRANGSLNLPRCISACGRFAVNAAINFANACAARRLARVR
jgi:hypothetical protein